MEYQAEHRANTVRCVSCLFFPAVLSMILICRVGGASRPLCNPPPYAPSPPNLAPPEGIVATQQRTHLTCTGSTWPRCNFEVTLTLANGATSDIDVPFAIWESRLSGVAWSIGKGSSPNSAKSLSVPSLGRADLVARGSITFVAQDDETGKPGWCGSLVLDPIFQRHIVTARPRHRFVARLPVLAPASVTTVSSPSGLSVRHEVVVREIAFGQSVTEVEFASKRSGSLLRVGGPFVGIGSQMRWDRHYAEAVLRTGYEIAHPAWLIHSLATESDFKNVVVLTPAVEAALTGNWSQIVSLGVGLPLRLTKETDVGVRGQFGIQFPLVGFVATFDFFPRSPGTVSMYFQLSL